MIDTQDDSYYVLVGAGTGLRKTVAVEFRVPVSVIFADGAIRDTNFLVQHFFHNRLISR